MSHIPPVQAFHASGPGGRGRGRGRGRRGRGGRGQGRALGGRDRGGGTQRGNTRKVLCPVCGIGFRGGQQVVCKVCSRTWHTRCVRNGSGGGTEFTCHVCSLVTQEEPQPPAPAQCHSPAPSPASSPAPAPTRPGPASRLVPTTASGQAVALPRPASVPEDVTGELLLQEPSDHLPRKPSYLDNMKKFDDKIQNEGFKRSDTQMNTPANGNCGPEGNIVVKYVFKDLRRGHLVLFFTISAFIDQLNWRRKHGMFTRDPPGEQGVAALLLR